MLVLILLLAFGAVGQQCALALTASGSSTTSAPAGDVAQALAPPTTGAPGCEGRPDAPTAETDVVRTVLLLDGTTTMPAPLDAPDSARAGTDSPPSSRDVPHRTPQDLCISRT